MIISNLQNEEWQKILNILKQWMPIGCKRLENRTTLIGHVPSVAPEAWLHNYYAPLLPSNIQDMEKRIGVKFPQEFFQFFCQTNGLNIFSDSLTIWGRRANFDRTLDAVWQPYDLLMMNLPEERPKDATNAIVFIGSYNWDGSKLYFDSSGSNVNQIYRCKSDTIQPLNVWTDFWSMLVQETKRLETLFNNKGIEKNFEVPTIPK